jgi:hypothetical protein
MVALILNDLGPQRPEQPTFSNPKAISCWYVRRHMPFCFLGKGKANPGSMARRAGSRTYGYSSED